MERSHRYLATPVTDYRQLALNSTVVRPYPFLLTCGSDDMASLLLQKINMRDCLHDLFSANGNRSMMKLTTPSKGGQTVTKVAIDKNSQEWSVETDSVTGAGQAQSLETHSSTHSAKIAARIGREVIGPLCYGFARWLTEQAREAGITQLYFLSRDGWLLKQAFDLLPQQLTAGLTSHYLYSSRRAVWFASLKEDTPEAEFNEILAGASPYIPVADFLTRVFIDPQECLPQIRAAGFDNEMTIVETASDKQKLYALFRAIKPKIVANAAQERADYLAYLKQSGVFDNKKAGLVDVGWTGSIIKYTRELVRGVDDSIDLSGYFIGVGGKAETKYGFSRGGCLQGYLFDFDDKSYLEILRCFFVIEKFLSPNEPSLIRMKRDEGGFRPVYKPGEKEYSPLNSIVQKSALQFVQHLSNSGATDRPFDVSRFLPQLKKLLSNPDRETAKLLSQYSYSSDFGYRATPKAIAKSESASVYVRKPLLLFKQYRRARWKAGFIALQPLPARIALTAVRKAKLDKGFERLLLSARKLR